MKCVNLLSILLKRISTIPLTIENKTRKNESETKQSQNNNASTKFNQSLLLYQAKSGLTTIANHQNKKLKHNKKIKKSIEDTISYHQYLNFAS